MPACWHAGCAQPPLAALRPLVADLLDRRHGVAQLIDPLGLVLGHQADAPGQRLAAAARHPGVDQRVERRRSPMRSRVMTGTPVVVKRILVAAALGAPGHGAAEGRLGLVGDAHTGPTGLLAEAADAGLLGHLDLVLRASRRAAGAGPGCRRPGSRRRRCSIVGLPSYQPSGTRPANQAPIRRSCSGPEGGAVAERRRPRAGPRRPPCISSSFILRDYTITIVAQEREAPPIPGEPPTERTTCAGRHGREVWSRRAAGSAVGLALPQGDGTAGAVPGGAPGDLDELGRAAACRRRWDSPTRRA